MKLPIIFNLVGLGIVVSGGILGAVLTGGPVDIEHYRLFDLPIASVGFLLTFGLVTLVADVVWRLRRRPSRDPLGFLDPSAGGQVMLVPVWLIGLGSLGWGAYQGTREGLALREEARMLIREIDLPPLFDRGRMEYSADGSVLGVIGYDGKGVPWNATTLERLTAEAPAVSFPENANDLRSEDGRRRVTWTQDRIDVQSASGPMRAIELGPDDCWARCVASVALRSEER